MFIRWNEAQGVFFPPVSYFFRSTTVLDFCWLPPISIIQATPITTTTTTNTICVLKKKDSEICPSFFFFFSFNFGFIFQCPTFRICVCPSVCVFLCCVNVRGTKSLLWYQTKQESMERDKKRRKYERQSFHAGWWQEHLTKRTKKKKQKDNACWISPSRDLSTVMGSLNPTRHLITFIWLHTHKPLPPPTFFRNESNHPIILIILYAISFYAKLLLILLVTVEWIEDNNEIINYKTQLPSTRITTMQQKKSWLNIFIWLFFFLFFSFSLSFDRISYYYFKNMSRPSTLQLFMVVSRLTADCICKLHGFDVVIWITDDNVKISSHAFQFLLPTSVFFCFVFLTKSPSKRNARFLAFFFLFWKLRIIPPRYFSPPLLPRSNLPVRVIVGAFFLLH